MLILVPLPPVAFPVLPPWCLGTMGKPKNGKLAALLLAAGGPAAARQAPSKPAAAGHKRPRNGTYTAPSSALPQQLQQVQEPEDVPTAGPEAYQQLMGMLLQSKGSASRALRRRRLEEQGDSDASSSDADEGQSVSDDQTDAESGDELPLFNKHATAKKGTPKPTEARDTEAPLNGNAEEAGEDDSDSEDADGDTPGAASNGNSNG